MAAPTCAGGSSGRERRLNLVEWLPDYAEYEHTIASLQLALAMLGMGALLSFRDFRAVFLKPRGLVVGLVTQLCVIPAVAALLASSLPLEPGMMAGLILVAAIPGGTLSNLITYVGCGNIALSIALTATTTVAALVTTPALLALLAGAHLPEDFEMPVARVARDIGISLILPLLTGMLLGAVLPARRHALSRWSIRASFFFIAVIVLGAASTDRIDPGRFGFWGPASLVLLAVGFGGAAAAVCRAAGLRSHERLAIVVETTLRNGNLGVLVKASLFPAVAGQIDPIGDAMLFSVILYGAIGLFAALPAALWHRRHGNAWLGEADAS